MANIAQMTASNRYYKARMEAAKHNERLSSQEGAAEATCISIQRIKGIERGLNPPHADEVVMMAAEYNAPELMAHYCAHECPIGRKKGISAGELVQLDRLAVRILTAIDGAKDMGIIMCRIAEDGKVSPEERSKVMEVMESLNRIAKVADDTRIWMEKYAKFPPSDGS